MDVKQILHDLGYKVLAILGEGIYSKVYSVLKNDQQLALKVCEVDARHFIRDGIPEDTLKECDISSRIRHPHLLSSNSILHLFVQKKLYTFIEMEQAESTLWELREENIQLKKKWFFQILCGVNALHKNSVIHADLKPTNVLLFRDKQELYARVGDYGLSVYAIPHDHRLIQMIQTKCWRAPEIMFKTVRPVSTAIDVFSLGVMLLELYTNNVIFRLEKEVQIMDKMRNLLGPPPEEFIHKYPNHFYTYTPLHLPEVPEEAKALAFRMMNWLPERRPSVEEVLQDPYFNDIKMSQECPMISLEPFPLVVLKEWHDLKQAFISKNIEVLQEDYKKEPEVVDLAVSVMDHVMSVKTIEQVIEHYKRYSLTEENLLSTLFPACKQIANSLLRTELKIEFNAFIQLGIVNILKNRLFYAR